jgi:23S rRNA (cytosine1962-C5)-methyltransferase
MTLPSLPAALPIIVNPGFADYALLDSGHGRKLERFGSIVLDRPEAQALWKPGSPAAWKKAHAVFSAAGDDDEKGKWRFDRHVPESWPVSVEGATMLLRLKGLWHVGLFPEQLPHWQWMLARLAAVKASGETPRVLNLFGYTGAASLIAAKMGAEVTHVDASKTAIAWGRDNQSASKLSAAKIRWILDDAAKFAARDVRRGKTYHMILVDPPKFGRGPDGEVWELFASLPALMRDCAQLLAPSQASLVLTVYAIRASALAIGQLVAEALAARKGQLEVGELMTAEESRPVGVPTSMFTRWTAE